MGSKHSRDDSGGETQKPQSKELTGATSEPVIHSAVPVPAPQQISLSSVKFRVLLAAAAMVLIVALGYFVWYKPHQPSAVLARSLMQTMQLESATVALSMKTGDQSKPDEAAVLTAHGAFTTAGSSGFELAGDYTIKQAKLGFDLRSPDGKDVYLKATGLAGLSGLLGAEAGQYGISDASNPFQALENTWLVIPKETQDALLKNSDVGAATGVKLSEADQQKIAHQYERHPFIVVTKTLADETIDGTASRHYQARINHDELVAFAEAVQKDVTALKLTDQQVQSVRAAKLPEQPVDVWVAGDSGYITQVRYSDGSGKDTSVVQVNLSKFNQPVKIEQPQGAKPLFEALGNAILGGAGLEGLPAAQLQ